MYCTSLSPDYAPAEAVDTAASEAAEAEAAAESAFAEELPHPAIERTIAAPSARLIIFLFIFLSLPVRYKKSSSFVVLTTYHSSVLNR